MEPGRGDREDLRGIFGIGPEDLAAMEPGRGDREDRPDWIAPPWT